MPAIAISVSALSVCSVLLYALERAAPFLDLIDSPQGHKTHAAPTPVVGGIAIVLTLLATAAFIEPAPDAEWLYLGITLCCALGIVDDLTHLGAHTKLYVMLMIFTLTLVPSDAVLHDLGALLPGRHIRAGWIAIPLTLFAAAGVANAFNLIDGLDGLAGTVALYALAGFWLLAYMIGAHEWLPLVAAAFGAMAAFLGFNLRVPGRRRARVFMGDAGSLAVGFLLLWLSIDLSQRPAGVPPIVMVWLLALPILDTLATMTLRMIEGKSVFAPGKDHLHHLLLALGASVSGVVAVAAVGGIASAATGILLWQLKAPEWLSALLFLGMAALYIGLHLFGWAHAGRRILLRTSRE